MTDPDDKNIQYSKESLRIARSVTQEYIEEFGGTFAKIDELDKMIACEIEKTKFETAKSVYDLFGLWEWVSEG